MLNLHPLFTRAANRQSLLKALDLTDASKEHLLKARDIVRNELRQSLNKVLLGMDKNAAGNVGPRFVPQGSLAYGTMNDPAHKPPQQVDVDDGAYLPLSFFKGAQPRVASIIYFNAVEAVLDPLTKRYGWDLDRTKASCTRVIIGHDMHIDVPLYAIPDKEYFTLQEQVAKAINARHDSAADEASEIFDVLPDGALLLAHREDGWQKQDPRPIKLWVARQVAIKTEQLRREMRYFKAARDWAWPNCDGPCSILLMAAVDQAMKQAEPRDDLAFMAIAERLVEIFQGSIYLDIPGRPDLAKELDEKKLRQAAITWARGISENMHWAIMETDDARQANLRLRNIFGPRFPMEPESITAERAAHVVKQHEPKHIDARPLLGRHHSGAVEPAPLLGRSRSG